MTKIPSRQRQKTLLCGDTEYELSPAYKQGALDCRNYISCYSNPFRDGSQKYYDWEYGHDNEAAGEHYRFGHDVITQSRKFSGSTIKDDPSIPRDEHGNVNEDWLESQKNEATSENYMKP